MTPITPALSALLVLQGDIKVHLISQGLSQECANAAAADLLDIVARSTVTRPEIAAAYAALGNGEPDPDEPQPGDWLVVVDDSDCTVRLGGPGHMWRCKHQSFHNPSCWVLEGVGSPYSKSIFRKATEAEVQDWVTRGVPA
jgi:hypothetical protein